VKRAALYLRVSTDTQRQLDTITSQRTSLEAVAEREGWTVVNIFEDNGVSGTTLDRPALSRLLESARAGDFEAVLVWSQDRLGRASVEDMLLWLGSFKTVGIPLIEATTMTDLTAGTGLAKLPYILKALMNEHERLAILERTSRGKREKVRQGRGRCRSLWVHGRSKGETSCSQRSRSENCPPDIRMGD
jgi:site-specific DNA recombinase